MATANRSVTDDDPVKGYAYNSEMEIDLYVATQKQIDGVYSMINFARQEQYYYLNDVFFTDIIMTEAEAYFSGIHTVNETLNAISLKLS